MSIREYWIQIENRWWDMVPNGINRMTGQRMLPQNKTLEWVTADEVGRPKLLDSQLVEMYSPVQALLLRRYKPPSLPDKSDAWTIPDDRRVNPWDLNEPDPTKTMGTIPGPTIECEVGDKVIVHFRNMDMRTSHNRLLHPLKRTHSLHPHGIAFEARYDGAYPLSPLDMEQPVEDDESKYFQILGARNFRAEDGLLYKRSDRVPPGGTFTYTWDTLGWASTRGVWLYHDHSVEDHHNVLMGAIGMLVIHDPNDVDDVFVDIDKDYKNAKQFLPQEIVNGSLTIENKYIKPPMEARYLQLYHELHEGGMCINGRRYLGNTPTFVGGLSTKMQFGLAAMNNLGYHTFHLHGHRWASTRMFLANTIGASNLPVIQFEDTRIFGPAESFTFTVEQGKETAPPKGKAKGEWHMHCHVLGHMMNGMMGSLLIVEEGDPLLALEKGDSPPSSHHMPSPPQSENKNITVTQLEGRVTIDDNGVPKILHVTDVELQGVILIESPIVEVWDGFFNPPELKVESGVHVNFYFQNSGHTITTKNTSPISPDSAIEINNGAGPTGPISAGQSRKVKIVGQSGTVINYQCGIHPEMKGTIKIR